jgi:hypothetical protein
MSRYRVIAATLLATGLVSACGRAAASSPSTSTSPRTVVAAAAPVRRAPSKIDRLLATARAIYEGQVRGPHSLAVLHRVGSDPILLRDLQAGQIGAARAYVALQFPKVWYHWHVSRLRIAQGNRLVTELGVPFVLPPSQMTLHGPGGRPVGTLQVSMQDEIGFVRLMHRRYPPVQVVIRGQGASHLRTSMRAAALAKLPASGSVRLGGRRYLVRSFTEPSWDGGPVTVWILAPA